MIRKVSILLTILLLTAASAFAQETASAQMTCDCLEASSECKCPEGSCCRAAEQAAATSATAAAAASKIGGSEADTSATAAAAASKIGGSETGTSATAAAAASKIGGSETDSSATAAAAASKIGGSETGTSATAAAAASKIGGNEEDISSQIPESLRYNEYYLKSLELSKQAQEAYDNGFYDGSIALAEEAVYYAHLSDKYVTEHLIAEAKRLVDWADDNNIKQRYPNDYTEGKTYYELSLEAQENTEWNEANIAAIKAIEILAPLEANKNPPLPGQYTVRTWANYRDCFWTIAGYPFVYGDPWKWRELYNANRSRLQNPNNPNVIEPGTVLDIPSIKGEHRQGMWDPNAKYEK